MRGLPEESREHGGPSYTQGVGRRLVQVNPEVQAEPNGTTEDDSGSVAGAQVR